MIDDKHGNHNVSSIFAENYKNLYNTVSYKTDDMNQVLNQVSENIRNNCSEHKCYSSHDITVEDVGTAIQKLKAQKADGTNDMMSDSVINGCLSLQVHLSLLFSTMLRHGVAPDNMLLSTLIPIPKNNKKCLNDSSNYRAIALGSILGKVLDYVIMEKSSHIFKSCDLQFGFKSKHSTTQCTYVLQEVIEYYNNNNSPVFLVTLDATKAFDRVEYCKLFNLLIDRFMCPLYVRLLIYMYTHQKLRVKWNGVCSPMFDVTNGVKQGGILSPLLFCIYVDVLLGRLRSANVGCYIGNNFVGSLGYADDICLLAPSCRAVKSLLSICEAYGLEYCVKFNSSKSHVTICSKNDKFTLDTQFTMSGETINVKPYVEHLGVSIGNVQCNQLAIDKGINDLVFRTNFIMSKFGSCTSEVRNFLFRTYCTSYYGCPLWRLNSRGIHRFYSTWRKCVRRIWKVPNTTHCTYLQHLYGGQSIKKQILLRFASFYCGAFNSKNNIVSFCAKLSETSNSNVAVNRRELLKMINNDGSIFYELENALNAIKVRISKTDCTPETAICHCQLIKELCAIRDKCLQTVLCEIQVEEMLYVICTF